MPDETKPEVPEVQARTDIGRVRKNNEDNFLSVPELGLFIVCDGMGGHNAGEVASETACTVIRREIEAGQKQRDRFLESGKPSDLKALRKLMENAIGTACKEIFKKASKDVELAGMGTTCTAILLVGHNKGILGHVGDSRLFVLRNGIVHQLSEDHTYVNELVKRGALTPEAAKTHPQGNVLSRALGVQPSVQMDSMIFDIDQGDTYLLCSDGMYNYYPDETELGRLLAGPELSSDLDLLIKTALDRGGHDNCTGILLRFGGKPQPAEASLAAEQRIAILKRIPLFAYLTYGELVKVVGLTQVARVAAGQTIIQEGDKGDSLFVVLSGEVDVFKNDNYLTTLPSGSHLGEMSMIDNAKRSATAKAKVLTNLLVMQRQEFFGLIRAEPVIATKLLWSFVQVLSNRLRATNAQVTAEEEIEASADELGVFVEEATS